MAPLIDYEMPLHDPPGRLHLPDDLTGRIRAYDADWISRITDRDLAGFDFSWLPALAQFDHWSVLGAGRLRDYKPGDFFREPIPNYLSLQLWSKLRYALGLRRGDLAAASAEVRHLADLLRTQGILIAEMIAVALYRLDARARDAAAAAGFDVSAWVAPDPDQLLRHRETMFAGMFFTYPGVDSETVKKAVECLPSPCPALLEGVGANHAFGAYGSSDNLQLVRELALKHGCEEAIMERAVLSAQLRAGDAFEIFNSEIDAQIPKHMALLPR